MKARIILARFRRAVPLLPLLGLGFVFAGCGSTSVRTVTLRVAQPPRVVTVTAPAKTVKVVEPAKTVTVHVRAKPTPTATPAVPAGVADSSDTTLTSYTDDGAAVELDDGSVWSVDSGDDVTDWSDGDAITALASDDKLVDTDTGEVAGATMIGDISDQNTYANTGDNGLAAMGDDGSILTLDDGSIWAVTDPYDQSTVTGWLDADDILVKETAHGYRLVNSDEDSSVSANYVGDE